MINAACVSATGLLLFAPLIRRQATARAVFFRQPWLFIALIAISLFVCRYSAFFYPGDVNPDEPEMLAQAITYETHPIPWQDIDGTTSGPINSYVLLWCLPFGIQPSYLTDRILELFCILGMLSFLYLAGRRLAGDLAARLALMPAFLFICWTSSTSFIYYSSEEVSIFLLSWALYLIARLRRNPVATQFIVQLGLVLGLLPFAKLQSILLGSFLGLTAIGLLVSRVHGNARAAFFRILILIAFAVAPALLILSIVSQAGALNDFWLSYIRMSQFYSSQHGTLWDKLKELAATGDWICSPSGDLAFPLYLTGGSTIVSGCHLLLGWQKASRATRNLLVWGIAFALISAATVFFPGRMYPHYQFFLLPPTIFLLTVNFRIAGLSRHWPAISNTAISLFLVAVLCCLLIAVKLHLNPRLSMVTLGLFCLTLALAIGWPIGKALCPIPSLSTPIRRLKFIRLAYLVPFFIIPSLIDSAQPNQFRGKIKTYLAQPLSAMDQAILRIRPPGGRLAIWGWAAEYPAETRTVLGTRDSISPFQISPSPLQNYYRQRYLHDLQTNRPELFLEATGPNNFAFYDPKLFGIETFPELAKLISEQYSLDTEIDGMRLFVRRDLANTKSKTEMDTP